MDFDPIDTPEGWESTEFYMIRFPSGRIAYSPKGADYDLTKLSDIEIIAEGLTYQEAVVLKKIANSGR